MKRTIVITSLLSIGTFFLATLGTSSHGINEIPPLYSLLPFVCFLLGIALIPLINGYWWHKNFPKFSFAVGLPMTVWVLFFNWHWLLMTGLEYLSFMALLGALFTISGGILIKGSYKVTPLINTFFLALGSLLASFIGTTGAAMLLIRPLIKANKSRKHKVHVIVFFIFLVANIGGSLTPLGDPPLFLGFLQGVSFFWTLKLTPAWLFAVGLLLIVFFILDRSFFKKELINSDEELTKTPLKIEGRRNFFLLAGVLATVIIYPEIPESFGEIGRNLFQIILLLSLAFLSIKITPHKTRMANDFTWFPIKEVAILFASIFVTMIPALKFLEANGAVIGVKDPLQFFWASGFLSSFLDNAPTYLTFLSLGKAVTTQLLSVAPSLATIKLFDGTFIAEHILRAISLGAVFMGANTYIGNGPNFMVKAIAEESGIKMPSFFAYMLWSLLFLVPIFILISIIFI